MNLENINNILREYLLTENEEQRKIVIGNYPETISELMIKIKAAFLSNDSAEIEKILNNNSEFKTVDFERLKNEYFENLALIHMKGVQNNDVDILIRNNNPIFTQILSDKNNEFDDEISSGFILNERKKLKSLLNNLSRKNNISDDDITTAFIINERKRIKNLFANIDSSKSGDTIDKMESKKSILAPWFNIAIAASFIGVIITTAIIFYSNRENPEPISDANIMMVNNGENQQNNQLYEPKNDTDLITSIERILALKDPISKEVSKNIISNKSLGFAGQMEKVDVSIIDISNKIKKIKQFENNKNFTDFINNITDSISKLDMQYSFDGTKLAIFSLKDITIPEIVKFDGKKYVCFSDKIFRVELTKKPKKLEDNIERASEEYKSVINLLLNN